MAVTSLAEPNDFGDFVTNLSSREGRQFDAGPYSPIFYWMGLFVFFYIAYGLFAYYVAPALFGYPYYYRPPFGKSYRRRRAVEADEGWNLSRFGESVLSQIDSFVQKYQGQLESE